MTFAAVVVSYNRLPLLKKCLAALEGQTRKLDEIIVVDNGSTDGSADYVQTHHPEITLFRTERNLGGAGGFAWGVEISLAHGHDAAWLMDDDAEPELDAAAPLIDTFQEMEPRPAFIASLVTAGRGVFNEGNAPAVLSDAQFQSRAAELGGFAVRTATFVGVMVNLKAAAATHLPLSDYFIWVDDAEYTHRLTDDGIGVMLPSSMVNHPLNKPGLIDRGPRLFYLLRNTLWYIKSRKSPVSTDALEIVALIGHTAKQFRIAASKRVWLSGVARGFWAGAFTRPTVQQPGDLLATLPPERRRAIGC